MPKVSVIIPVYGVEKYIERCARSLFEQTLDDIEYLFIDDCTPDKSIEVLKNVLEEYPNRKEQVIIHHMEQNSGQAAVRKWGMQNATGEYVIHCDSDDWVDTDMYRAMYETAIVQKTDVVICDYFTSDGENKKVKKYEYPEDNKQLIIELLFEKGSWAVWNKLCKRNLYKENFAFPQDDMGEDLAITIQLIFHSKKIKYLDAPLYYYFDNPTSITSQNTIEGCLRKFSQACNNVSIVEKTLGNDLYYKDALLNIKAVQRNLLLRIIKEPGISRMWLQKYPGLTWKIMMSPQIERMQKVRAIYYQILSMIYQFSK